MRELALFAGAGGGILGGKLLGWRTVCAVERDAYAAQVLAQRQNDGVLEPFPIWSDITTFDGKPWRGVVDVVSGGFPCQDISAAGKGAGIEGARSGMWKEMARIIGEVQPKYAFVENSPMLTTRGLGTVLADLAAMGFDAEWGVLSAADVGANHQRERIWIVANSKSARTWPDNGRIWQRIGGIGGRQNATQTHGTMADIAQLHSNASKHNGKYSKCKVSEFGNGSCENSMAHTNLQHGQRRGESQQPTSDSRKAWNQPSGGGDAIHEVSDANSTQRERKQFSIGINQEHSDIGEPCWWQTEPDVGRVANGVAFAMDRLKAIGNGQVPLCAATAFELLRDRLNDH